ncbi:MAG TPA: hypothetical protein VIK32_14400, partial [Candidatus Limnocylindrales bacterium]
MRRRSWAAEIGRWWPTDFARWRAAASRRMWLGVGKPNGHFGQRRSVANFFALLLALAALGAGTTRPARAAEPGALANVR